LVIGNWDLGFIWNLDIVPKMLTSNNPYTCQARLIGEEARRLLTPGFSGRVLAVLSNIIYLIGKGDEILWIAQDSLPVQRRCILTSFPLRSICPGQPFSMGSHSLQVGESLLVELNQAVEWRPSTVGPRTAAPLPNVMAGMRGLVGTLQVLGSVDGLGEAIVLISAVGDDRAIPPLPMGSLVARAASSIQDLARACMMQDITQVALIGRELVGLGPGLTPSGDDFLGGLLFAVCSLKKAYPGKFQWEEEPFIELIAWARTRTHPISHAILNDLAHGHGPEPLHDLVSGLLKSEDLDRVMRSVIRLLNIGQTSGWDILAGVLTGMLMAGGGIKKAKG
jgi:hypothetical protein